MSTAFLQVWEGEHVDPGKQILEETICYRHTFTARWPYWMLHLLTFSRNFSKHRELLVGTAWIYYDHSWSLLSLRWLWKLYEGTKMPQWVDFCCRFYSIGHNVTDLTVFRFAPDVGSRRNDQLKSSGTITCSYIEIKYFFVCRFLTSNP